MHNRHRFKTSKEGSATQPSRRATAILVTGTMLIGGGVMAGLGTGVASASSHREAPAIGGHPRLDTTDLYAFVSPDKANTVTLIANWIPFEEPAGGPNFYQFATGKTTRYEINIDNNGDAKPDVTYRWTFANTYQNRKTFLANTGQVTSLKDPDLNFRQSYTLTKVSKGSSKVLVRNAPVAPSYVGAASMPNYQGLRDSAVVPTRDGSKSFAGQADDPFFADLRVFDLLYGADLSEVGNDTLAGYNVNTVAVQVPKSAITRRGEPVVGIWSTTQQVNSRGRWVQVSRLGNPLVNEVVIPVKDKNKFNASLPKNDSQFGSYVVDPELPKLIKAIYGVNAPPSPRNDLVSVFLTGVAGLNKPAHVRPSEQLRLNTSIAPAATPKRLGVLDGDTQGFPNGRRLTDDVLDIAVQAAEGEVVGPQYANDLGDAVNTNDAAFGATFPYVALPNSGSLPMASSAKGSSLTNGGAFVAPRSPMFPAMPTALVAFGLLALVGGAVTLRRSGREPVTA